MQSHRQRLLHSLIALMAIKSFVFALNGVPPDRNAVSVSVCGAVSSSVRLSSLPLTVCSQTVSSHQHFWYQTKHIVLSFTSKDWIRFMQHPHFFFFFFTNQGCSSVTLKRLWLRRGLRKRYLKTGTDLKKTDQLKVVHENVGFWCNWGEAVHTCTSDIWLYPEMKTCSNILRLTQTLKGPHVHTHYQRSMKGNIYIKLGAGNSGCSWIETLDSQRADGFSLGVTDTVRCRTYAQSDGNKGQKNPVVNRQTGITWWGFQMTCLNVLWHANFSFSNCVPAKHKLALMYKLSLFYHLPQTELDSSSEHGCLLTHMCWGRWRRILLPRTSIFGGAQTEHWPRCRWVPSATTERSQAPILAIYNSCQLGSCFFSCSRCARQAWPLLWWSDGWASQRSRVTHC